MIEAACPFGMTGKVCLKSPPKRITFPPNSSLDPVKSFRSVLMHLKASFLIDEASSMIIKLAPINYLALTDDLFIFMIESLSRVKGN